MNTTISYQTEKQTEQTLNNVDKVFRKESQEFKDMLTLLGWQNLPDKLLAEIVLDIADMKKELQLRYCSTDNAKDLRRRQVHYWVESYRQGTCSLETAVNALKDD